MIAPAASLAVMIVSIAPMDNESYEPKATIDNKICNVKQNIVVVAKSQMMPSPSPALNLSGCHSVTINFNK